MKERRADKYSTRLFLCSEYLFTFHIQDCFTQPTYLRIQLDMRVKTNSNAVRRDKGGEQLWKKRHFTSYAQATLAAAKWQKDEQKNISVMSGMYSALH